MVVVTKRSILKWINAAIPPQLSYSFRKYLNHASVAEFQSFDEYYFARFDTKDHIPAAQRRELQKFREFAKDCIEAGEPDRLIGSATYIPRFVWTNQSFRRDYFIALISLNRIDEARNFVRETLTLGAYSKNSLLRIIGDVYLTKDDDLARSIYATIFNSGFNISYNERIYIINVILNITGDDSLIDFDSIGINDHNSLFFLSNVYRFHNDISKQVSLFNRALYSLKMPPIYTKDGANGLSVTNILSSCLAKISDGPLVSIAMSTFNSSSTITHVLESLTGQSYRNIEILIVDDCSTDNTIELARQFATADGRIRVFEQAKNGGTYRARNRALLEAKGEFFTCNDSDDWAHPERIQSLMRPLLMNRSTVATMGSLLRLNRDVGVKPKIKGYVHVDQSSLCYRREWALSNIGFYEDVLFGADSEFSARLAKVAGASSIEKIDKPLLFAEWSRSSLSGAFETGITDGGTMAPKRIRYSTNYKRRHNEGHLFVPLPRLDDDLD